MITLQQNIETLFDNPDEYNKEKFSKIASELIDNLNSGTIRAAEPSQNGEWKVNIWVKKGILLLFRHGQLIDMSLGDTPIKKKIKKIMFGMLSDMTIGTYFPYFDKNYLPVHPFNIKNKVRIVPGGSSIRTGCYVAEGVICMPPMYINIGSYVDSGTMIDSHALVGTCAQVGKNVHVSAAAQIGGVLEPPGARPVIIEDNVMIGGNCGIYEGTLVRKRAVFGSGVILTASTKVFDLVNEKIIKSENGKPLEIPEGAVLVPGSRTVDTPFAKQHGLSIASPLIIKYRDEKTDARTALEESLR
jgi:2,3,4,5-tetrahydropyridine-2,6-dicarboxylate N-succinyltransferase